MIKCKYWIELSINFRGIGVKRPPPAKFDVIMGCDSIYKELFGIDKSRDDDNRFKSAKSASISRYDQGFQKDWKDNSHQVRGSDISITKVNKLKSRGGEPYRLTNKKSIKKGFFANLVNKKDYNDV
jgi:hypothetical protein